MAVSSIIAGVNGIPYSDILLHACVLHSHHSLHAAGVEVLLDVAYNHTAEGGDEDPYVISLRGIENNTYYMLGGGQVNVGCLRHLLLVCVGAFTNNATFLFCKWASMLVSRPWPYDTVPIPRLCVRVCVCVFVCVCVHFLICAL